MSKASEWAKRAPKELHLRSADGPWTTLVFPVIENGEVLMRIDNAGPFNKREALRLARWIHATFGDDEPRRPEGGRP